MIEATTQTTMSSYDTTEIKSAFEAFIALCLFCVKEAVKLIFVPPPPKSQPLSKGPFKKPPLKKQTTKKVIVTASSAFFRPRASTVSVTNPSRSRLIRLRYRPPRRASLPLNAFSSLSTIPEEA